MAYATLDDLTQGWRDLTPSEQERATTLLDRASTILDTLVTVDPDDEQQAKNLTFVVCEMVKRAMAVGADAYGVTQVSHMAGAFQESMSFQNPNGDMYLTEFEYKLLGISGAKAGWKQIGGRNDCWGDNSCQWQPC